MSYPAGPGRDGSIAWRAMKRKRADRADWRRITQRRFAVTYLDGPEFTGYVALLWIDAVRAPMWDAFFGRGVTVADVGYSWLQHFPSDGHAIVTTMFDAGGNIIEWYVDIIADHGVGDDGVPWYDDLYLDVVALPTGEVAIVDGDELNAALRAGDIDENLHEMAWSEALQVREAIHLGQFDLFRLAPAHRALLEAQAAAPGSGTFPPLAASEIPDARPNRAPIHHDS